MWRRRHPAEAQLVAEWEAFLAGGLAQTLSDADGRVPVRTWMYLLAHGRVADVLAACVPPRPMPDSLPGDWCRARSFLAGEALDRVEPGQDVVDSTRLGCDLDGVAFCAAILDALDEVYT